MKSNLFFIGLALTPCASLAQPNSRPNIVYILADDLGYAELGCYGQQLIETPNIDKLTGEGMRFTNHYSGQAVSAPSRCSLLTGLHSGHSYIRGNDPVASRGDVWNFHSMIADSTLEGQRPMPAHTITIPKKLKEAGYTTACIGKWGLGWPGSESTPNKMGFDFFYGYNCQRMAHNYYVPFLYRNEAREYMENEVVLPNAKLDKGSDPSQVESYAKFTQKNYSPDKMFDEVIRFVRRSAGESFSLFWTTPLPHMPLQAPQRWVDYYVKKWGDEKPYLGEQGYFPCRYPHATYAAMISYFDEQVGMLVEELKRQGVYENTLIVFASDNGPTFNGGADSPYFDSAKPFKSEAGWGKANLREGGIRVPMIAVWPGHIPAHSTSDMVSAFWDMMPTLCEVAGVSCPPTDGISLLSELTGHSETQKQHDFLYWEFPESGGQKAVRMGDWKAFVGDIKKGNRQVELYNLAEDPREQHNVAEQHPELVRKALELFRNQHTEPEVKGFALPVW